MTDVPMNASEKPMSLLMRIIFWVVVLNAFGGALALMVFPTRTDTLFFWTITPPINAVLFGALFLATGLLVAPVARRARWEPARFLTPMIVSSASLLLLTTIAHMERFIPGPRLYYWLAIYTVAPLAAITFYMQHERDGANWQAAGEPIRGVTRALALITGALLAVFIVAALAAPQLFTPAWPWPMSPLMLRASVSAWSAFAAGLLWFGRERDWGRVAPVANMLIILSALVLALILIHRADLNPGAGNLWLVVAGVAALGVVGALMRWLQRKPTTSSQQAAAGQAPG